VAQMPEIKFPRRPWQSTQIFRIGIHAIKYFKTSEILTQ